MLDVDISLTDATQMKLHYTPIYTTLYMYASTLGHLKLKRVPYRPGYHPY